MSSSVTIDNLIIKLERLNNEINDEINFINGLTSEDSDSLQSSINTLENIRKEQEEIYTLLQSMNNSLYSNFVSAKTLNDHQNNLATKLDKYRINIEDEISMLEEQKNHSTRLSKINKYYGDKYDAHSQLIKLIIKILVPFIILAVLKNKGFLPEDAFNSLILVIIVIGGILFFKKYKDVVSRDNMNYQEYDWRFRKDLAPNDDNNNDNNNDDDNDE